MWGFDADVIVPIMIFAIPIVAIVGGITMGIVQSLGRQRLAELAQQERIAAIQKGVDPTKLPPLSVNLSDDIATVGMSPAERANHRAQGLMIGGIITLAVGGGIVAFLSVLNGGTVWAVGIIPMFVGAALLLCSWLVRPRGGV